MNEDWMLQADGRRESEALGAARRRSLRRALVWMPIGIVVLAVGFAMEAFGIGRTELLEIPLHVWVKLPGAIALIYGGMMLRGFLRPDQLKPLW